MFDGLKHRADVTSTVLKDVSTHVGSLGGTHNKTAFYGSTPTNTNEHLMKQELVAESNSLTQLVPQLVKSPAKTNNPIDKPNEFWDL